MPVFGGLGWQPPCIGEVSAAEVDASVLGSHDAGVLREFGGVENPGTVEERLDFSCRYGRQRLFRQRLRAHSGRKTYHRQA